MRHCSYIQGYGWDNHELHLYCESVHVWPFLGMVTWLPRTRHALMCSSYQSVRDLLNTDSHMCVDSLPYLTFVHDDK